MMIKNNLYKALFLSLSLTTLTLSSCQKSEDQTATSEVRTITFGISNVPQSDDALTRAADQRPDTIYKQLGNGIMMQTVITPQRQVLTRTNGDYMVDDGDKVLVIPVGSDGKVTSDPMTETVDGTKLTVKNLPSGTTRLVF
ncbi:MAG: hypothetical protein LBN24_00680, partial [Mediterranea sp.]|nr:hypothetical protein [Mediterranea sp.]